MRKVKKLQLIKGPSRTMQTAKRLGIDVEFTEPHLPITEQEQADIE